MRRTFILASIVLVCSATLAKGTERKTAVSIKGEAFLINGIPTYAGRIYKGMKIEGLLLNSRMVQGIFDDRNPQTLELWKYPDGPWNPQRNTREFVAAMPLWKKCGLIAFTINFQGGSPQGYSNNQPWDNSAFDPDGSLRSDYVTRLERILDKADELGMVVILGYIYFGPEPRFTSDDAIIKACDNATDWILGKGYTNLLIEVANETNNGKYKSPLLKPERAHELIERTQKRSEGKVKNPAGRLLVSTSFTGGKIPPENVVAVADYLLLHGNGQNVNRIRPLVDQTRQVKGYRSQPILFNEDDHFDFEKPDNHFIAAVSRGAGWGYFDFRMAGEGFDEGYQSVPVNWGISSARKRGFFTLLAEMTGGEKP
jgi:hypothetical protein